MNFQATTSLFSTLSATKLFCLLFLALSCLGTTGVKAEKISRSHIAAFALCGFLLFWGNSFLLKTPLSVPARSALYVSTLGAGYICLLTAGVWVSRLLRTDLMRDVFNDENESFLQETRYLFNKYSINIPTLFYYKKKWNPG